MRKPTDPVSVLLVIGSGFTCPLLYKGLLTYHLSEDTSLWIAFVICLTFWGLAGLSRRRYLKGKKEL